MVQSTYFWTNWDFVLKNILKYLDIYIYIYSHNFFIITFKIMTKFLQLKYVRAFLFVLLCTLISSTFTACGDDEPEIKFNDITLNCGRTYTIPNGNNIMWTSSNEYIASVSGNIVKAERVGEATISSNKGSFKVKVNGSLTSVYPIPCLEWGASKSTVKNFMKGYSLDEEESTSLTYIGTGSHLFTIYTFESGILSGSAVALNGNYIDAENLADYMLERYVPVSVDEDNYSFYFVTPDNKTMLGLFLEVYSGNIVYTIVYLPRDSKSRSLEEFDYLSIDAFEFEKSDIVKPQFEQIRYIISR